MATCFNRNTKEFKALLEVYDHPYIVDAVITGYQKRNKTDVVPTPDEAAKDIKDAQVVFSLKQRAFKEALIQNISRNSIATRKVAGGPLLMNNSPRDTQKYDEDFLQSNVQRLYSYLSTNNIPLDSVRLYRTQSGLTYRVEIDEGLFSAEDILPSSRGWDTTRANQVFFHLQRLFPQIRYQYVTPAEAKNYYDKLPEETKANLPKDFRAVNAFFDYSNNAVTLIKGRLTNDTPIEEMLHPFVDTIAKDNVELFNGLLEEAKKAFPVLKQQIDDAYTDDRGFDETYRNLELVTQSLTRHFRNEYETEPTKSYMDKIMDLLKWFSNLINDLHKYLTGRGIPEFRVEMLKPTMSLSDVAKLLNTSDIQFSLSKPLDRGIKFSLSPERLEALQNIKKQARKDSQRKLIDNLFFHAGNSSESIEQFAAGMATKDINVIVFDQATSEFVDITDGSVFSSVEELINAEIPSDIDAETNKKFKNYVKNITTGIAEGKSFEDIKDSLTDFASEETAEKIYEDLYVYVNGLKAFGDVVIPSVTIFDRETQTADTVDFLLLGIDGKIKVVNISVSPYDYVKEDQSKYSKDWELSDDSVLKKKAGINSLSKQAQDALRANLQKRILENMGYEVIDYDNGISTYHIQFNPETLDASIKGYLDYTKRTNQPYVDMLVPESMDKRNEFGVKEILREDEFDSQDFVRPEDLDYQFSIDDIDYIYSEKIIEALKNYKENLEKRAFDIRNLKGAITLNKTKEAALDKIDAEIKLIMHTLASKDDSAMSALVTDILISSIKDVRELTEYLEDEANASSSDYISIINNASDFLRLWNGFVDTLPVSEDGKVTELTVNQLKLKDRLQSLIIKLSGQNATGNRGLLREARFKYVVETIYNTTSQDLTKDEIEAFLNEAVDITATTQLARDLATSPDRPSAIIDKIYKRAIMKRQEILNRLQDDNLRLAATVARLSGANNAKDIWSWMYETDANGNPTGRYITEIGEIFHKQKAELWDALRDEKGQPLEYIMIEDLSMASKEDIQYNIELYEKKSKLAQFLAAESIDDNGMPEDGEYMEYTQEFKDARDKVQVWSRKTKKFGQWEYRDGITEKEKRDFENRYFDFKTINKAVKENGVFTGKVIKLDNVPFAKTKYKKPRLISKSGLDMRSEKYKELMNDASELGIARRSYYEFWKKNYENDLLNRIPVSERDKMLGAIPLVSDNMTDSLFKKGSTFAGIAAKFKSKLSKSVNKTRRFTRVFVDSEGNPVDSLPIMYTGSPQNPERIEKLKEKIDALDLELNKNPNDIELIKELEVLKRSLAAERGKPLREEISFDLPATMDAFAAMAINYDVMSDIEETITAFIETMEETNYRQKDTVVSKAKAGIGVKSKVRPRARALERVLWWKNNVFYGNYRNSESALEKGINNFMRYSSLTYVAFNPTGNLNNWIMGRVNNAIEQLGGRFFSGADYRKSEAEFYATVLPHSVLRFAKRTADLTPFTNKYRYNPDKPMNLYEALVDEYAMLDPKAELREFVEGSKAKSFKTRLIEFGYSGQDAGEYQLQTTVGNAILRGTYVRNSVTNEIVSVRDAYYYDAEQKKAVMKEGFDETVLYNKKTGEFKVTGAFDDNFRYDLRNTIREANKQIHGSYSKEDVMVIEGMLLGRMATQFKKWVMPAIRNRVQDMYYDENLGWIEGRYNSLWRFLGTAKRYLVEGKRTEKSLVKQFLADTGYNAELGEFNQKNIGAVNALKNLYRNMADVGLILLVLLVGELFDLMEADEDDTLIKRRLINLAKYQSGRLLREQTAFIPVLPQGAKQMYEQADSPFAVLRVGYEAYEAIAASISYGYYKGVYATTGNEEDWYLNKEVFYQRGTLKGTTKVSKQWRDVIPALYGLKKIQSLDTEQEYWIK